MTSSGRSSRLAGSRTWPERARPLQSWSVRSIGSTERSLASRTNRSLRWKYHANRKRGRPRGCDMYPLKVILIGCDDDLLPHVRRELMNCSADLEAELADTGAAVAALRSSTSERRL